MDSIFGNVTLEGVAKDVRTLQSMARARSLALLETLVLEHRLACSDPECAVCGALDCPANEPAHYAGCPVCGVTAERV